MPCGSLVDRPRPFECAEYTELTLFCAVCRWYGFPIGPVFLPFNFATKMPNVAEPSLSFSIKPGPLSLFSFHLGALDFRFLKQKNNRPLIKAKPATPPMIPPTILPMLASLVSGRVSPPPPSGPCSGAIMPADPPDGRETRAEVACCGCSVNSASVGDVVGSTPVWLGCSGFMSADDWPADTAGAVKSGGMIEDATDDKVGTAIATVSEVDAAGFVEEAEVTAATCEGTAAGLLNSSAGCPGPAAAGPDGARFASGIFRADDIGTALIVPIAEVTATSVVGAVAGCSAIAVVGCSAIAVEEGGGGGGASAALVCICGASSMAVEVVNSVGVRIDGSSVVRVEVAAVRARDRVHLLPLTVVIDSCGEAIQATAHRKKCRQGLRRGGRGKELQTPRAL